MSTVVVDAATRAQLLTAGAMVEFRDAAGELIGRFARTDGPPAPPAGYEVVGEWPSDEEIDRREREGKFHSAAEVEAFLAGMRRAAK